MSDTIWYSRLSSHDTFIPFDYAPSFIDGEKKQSIKSRNWAGEVLSRDDFPEFMIERHEDDPEVRRLKNKIYKNLPNVFDAHLILVSERVAGILDDFDMDGGKFYPMPLLSEERGLLSGAYFAWNFGSVKHAFAPEQCEGFDGEKMGGRTIYFESIVPPKGGWLGAVKAEALDGPDMWVDPIVHRVLFLKGKVVAALKATGFAKSFPFHPCEIVD